MVFSSIHPMLTGQLVNFVTYIIYSRYDTSQNLAWAIATRFLWAGVVER